MTDPSADLPAVDPPAVEPPPLELAPMRPLDSPPPDPMDRRWVYQYEALGERVVVHVHGALSSVGLLPTVRIVNGEARDLSGLFPELDDLAAQVAAGPFTIDGVLTAADPVTDIMYRLAATDPADAKLRAATSPVHYIVRDLVHIDGRRVGDMPYSARRELLMSRVQNGPGWSIPEDHLDPAAAILEGSHRTIPMPLLLSRRLDSRHFSGMSGRGWLRTAYPMMRRLEIVGWEDDRPGDNHHFDGLLIAGDPGDKGLRQVQVVRAGLTSQIRRHLAESLMQLPVSGTPAGLRYTSPDQPTSTVHRWARRGVGATVMGSSMTPDRCLGHPVLLEVFELN